MRSGPGRVDRLALEPDLALDRLHVAADRLEQRRLAAAGRSEQHEAVGPVDLEVDAIGRGDEMVARLVLQRDAAHGEQRRPSARRSRVACQGSRSRSTLPPLMMMPTRLPPTSSVRSSRHASGTADDGSTTIFIRSHIIRIARTIAVFAARARWRRRARGARPASAATASCAGRRRSSSRSASGSMRRARSCAAASSAFGGLRAVDTRSTAQRRGGDRRAGQQAAAADGRDDDVEVGTVLEQLERRRRPGRR